MINSLSPILRVIASQIVVFVLLLLLRGVFTFQMPVLLWLSLQVIGAVVIGRWWHLGPYWMLFQVGLPVVVAFQMGHFVPLWLYPLLLTVLLLIYGGGIFSRVPLYNSGAHAWRMLTSLIPENEKIRFVDLGAGLGGPLAHIARHRPQAELIGVEASPLVWLIGWLRTARYRPRCVFRLGSIWKTELKDAQIVYAFLSPVPMSTLWQKVKHEMKPGSIFVSHSFGIPGFVPDRRIPLPGRKDAVLLVYNIGK